METPGRRLVWASRALSANDHTDESYRVLADEAHGAAWMLLVAVKSTLTSRGKKRSAKGFHA